MRSGKDMGQIRAARDLGDGYMEGGGKLYFNGKELDGVSAAPGRAKNIGQGYVKTADGHLLYKGQTVVENSNGWSVGQVSHLDGDWSTITSGGDTKYVYRGEIVGGKQDAIDRGCTMGSGGQRSDQAATHASTQPHMLVPEQNILGQYHKGQDGNVYYK